MALRHPFFKPHKERFLNENGVSAEDQAALDAEKLFLCKSGELAHILDTWPNLEDQEREIRSLMGPRLRKRFDSGITEFDLHLQEGVISFIFRHDARLGGGPDNTAGWARTTISLALFREEIEPQPKTAAWTPDLVLSEPIKAKPAPPKTDSETKAKPRLKAKGRKQ